MASASMGSAPTSRLSFLDAKGGPRAAPLEWAKSYIAIEAPAERWEEFTLTRNGEPLVVYARPFDGEPRIVADWPLSGTGHYRLELSQGEKGEERVVSVWPRKIS